jgi:hypothetical protein
MPRLRRLHLGPICPSAGRSPAAGESATSATSPPRCGVAEVADAQRASPRSSRQGLKPTFFVTVFPGLDVFRLKAAVLSFLLYFFLSYEMCLHVLKKFFLIKSATDFFGFAAYL